MFTHFLSNLYLDENGQGTVEYILIISVIVVGAAQIRKQVLKALDKGLLRIGSQIEKDIKTGRAPLSVWEN